MTDAAVDVTGILDEVGRGVPGAVDRLAAAVVDELHRIAERAMRREDPGHTLQPTELVHEAFMRLVGGAAPPAWEGRAHFYAAAAQVIRRLLVDHARRRRRLKRDHGVRVTLDGIGDAALGGAHAPGGRAGHPLDLIALDDALARLEAVAPRQARVVELRFFGGLAAEETAVALGVSLATVKRDWTFARAFLLRALDEAS